MATLKIRCKTCGFENNTDRDYCSSCGCLLAGSTVVEPRGNGCLGWIAFIVFVALALIAGSQVRQPGTNPATQPSAPAPRTP